MIPALLIGRKGSVGFPGKNTYPVLGRPLTYYPLMAAKNSEHVDEIYVSTDCPEIKKITTAYEAILIDRPAELCTNKALGEDVFVHGYKHIRYTLKKDVEMIVLLHCNSATLTTELINEGIAALRKDPSLDSATSVSAYNMWSPIRARKINKDNLLDPFVPFAAYGDPAQINCDRDSFGDVWFADMAVSIVRPRCLEHIHEGLLPQRWMGKRIYPLKQWGGCDVDGEWQIPQVEFWLKKHNITEARANEHYQKT